MTQILTIIIILLIALWLTKKWWATALVSAIKNRKNKPIISTIAENSAIFQPIGTIRTFNFSLDIEENGDGTVKMSINKIKE